MDRSYFEQRLLSSILSMRAASDPCARLAHRGLACGYLAILDGCTISELASTRTLHGQLSSITRGSDDVIGQWTVDAGSRAEQKWSEAAVDQDVGRSGLMDAWLLQSSA